MKKVDDVKNFVVRTLWERCEFSKSASRISDDEDYIERFMFEKKEGDSHCLCFGGCCDVPLLRHPGSLRGGLCGSCQSVFGTG